MSESKVTNPYCQRNLNVNAKQNLTSEGSARLRRSGAGVIVSALADNGSVRVFVSSIMSGDFPELRDAAVRCDWFVGL